MTHNTIQRGSAAPAPYRRSEDATATSSEPVRSNAVRLSNATLITVRGAEQASLEIENGRITAAHRRDGWDLNLKDHLIFPGMVNAHDHLHLNCIPKLPHAEPFPNSYVWMDAFQPFMNDAKVRAAKSLPHRRRCWHGALKNLLGGVTTVAHHDPYESVFEHPDFPVYVPRDNGWAHSLGLGLPNSDASALRYGPDIVASFQSTPANRPWIIHLSEGVDSDPAAAAELAMLDRLRCLKQNTVIVHGLALSERDISRIEQSGASVVWCPTSNLEMFGQTLNPTRLAASGLLALGTDSRLTGCGSLLGDLRAARAESELTSRELFSLVTAAPARILRLPDVGDLHPGCRADLLILRRRSDDPYDTLVNAKRGDIRAVVRNGMPAIGDPDFATWFQRSGIPATRITVDGRPKLCATCLLNSDLDCEFGFAPGCDPNGSSAIDLEPGVQRTPEAA